MEDTTAEDPTEGTKDTKDTTEGDTEDTTAEEQEAMAWAGCHNWGMPLGYQGNGAYYWMPPYPMELTHWLPYGNAASPTQQEVERWKN